MSIPHIPDISARQLAAVLAVAEYRSFIAAASALRTSQPALTRTIKRIEDVLGVKLFERSTRHVNLTHAGLEFVAVAQRITNDLRITATSMRELADQERGQVIVTCIMSVANSKLPKIVAGYKDLYPGIEVHVRDGIHGAVNEDVRSGVADFGINYLKDTSGSITAERLGSEEFELVAPEDHPLARDHAGVVPFAALAGHRLVSMPPDLQTRRIVDAAAVASGVHLRHAVIVAQIPTLMSFVRAGAGVGVVPSTSTRSDLTRGLEVRSISDPAIALDTGIVTLRDRELTPAASGLLAAIREHWSD